MNRTKLLLIDRAASLFLAVASVLLAGLGASAQNVQHLSMTYEGGMPGSNVVTGVTLVTNAVKVTGVKVTWDGPPGYYQLFESPGTNDPVWVKLTRHNVLSRTATVPARYSNAFFRVSGPSSLYAGSERCAECHAPILKTEMHTRHAAAFTNALFEADGGQTNSSCLACHTVGFDLPTGFVSQTETPHLAGIQCENCHGPAAHHAANPDDPSVRPRAEVAAQVCGGCHNDPHHPTFDEWTNSAHALVTNLLVKKFNAARQMMVTNLNLDAANQINHCGRCHSGSVRLSLLETNRLPAGDADIGIVCVTCHDPHQTNANPAQLRNPIASTNDYFMPTNGTFAKLYNREINICAQCHNHAGASWTNNNCEPHHSLQYNMLLGTIGEVDFGLPTNQPPAHLLEITNQCVGCHMQTTPFVSEAQPAVTGHSFKVEKHDICVDCHYTTNTPFNEFLMTNLVTLWTNLVISPLIQQVKTDLDFWATSTNAPASLSAKYGTLAWEYTTPGSLSSGGPGPDAKEQLLIPENIRKARFNLYVVQNDGTLGIHNPVSAPILLEIADDWIYEQLGLEMPYPF
jgi:hypothetical protein